MRLSPRAGALFPNRCLQSQERARHPAPETPRHPKRTPAANNLWQDRI